MSFFILIRIVILPTSATGTWAARGLLVFLGLYLLSTIIVITSQVVNDTEILLNPGAAQALRILGPLAVLVGAATGVTSIIAVVKYHDRSVVAWVGVGFACLIALLLLGEIVLPH